MIRQDFNAGWSVARDVSGMMGALYGENNAAISVTLPDDAMIREEKSPNSATGNSGAFYPGGNYIYTKNFFVPEDENQHLHILEFEASYHHTQVFLNQAFVTACPNGYRTFLADLTPHLKYGQENQLTVRVQNGAVPNSRWYTGSGLYRPVWLLKGGQAHIAPYGLRITTPEVSADISTIATEIHLQYHGTQTHRACLKTRILNASGVCVAEESTAVTLFCAYHPTVRQRIYLENADLWSLESPALYTCEVKLELDHQTEDTAVASFGIRHIQIDPKYGLRLNGKKVLLRGACIHHDNGVIGALALDAAEERRVRIMKEAGFNAIRIGHAPASRALLNACDKYGMLLMEETYDMWNESKTPYDDARDFADQWEKDLESLVNKDFNHPCVFLYSIGNEIGEINRPGGARINRELAEKIRRLDPTRFVSAGVNGMVATMENIFGIMQDLGMITQEQRYAMEHPESPEAKAMSGDINDVMTMLMGRMNELGRHHTVDDILNESFSALDVPGYNYMYGRYELDAKKYPNRVFFGSETLPCDIDILWNYTNRLPALIGDFTWTGWDYLGEAGAGQPRYGDETGFFSAYPVFTAQVGDIDITGFRRPTSYYREIVFGLRTRPFLAAQLPSHYADTFHGTPWATTDAVQSWTWPGFQGCPIRVEVYSAADEVELQINGKTISRQAVGAAKRFRAVFDTIYQAGQAEAIAYTNGIESGRASLVTAGYTTIAGKLICLSSKRKIVISPDKIILNANAQDAAYLQICVTDENGTVDTAWNGSIHLEISGCGTLQGFASADPCSEENYTTPDCALYFGRALAVIRSSNQAGEICCTASADGLDAVAQKLQVKPVPYDEQIFG